MRDLARPERTPDDETVDHDFEAEFEFFLSSESKIRKRFSYTW